MAHSKYVLIIEQCIDCDCRGSSGIDDDGSDGDGGKGSNRRP